ncbi:MAG TPA: hypothetical protein VN657_14375 [Nitrospiraceae bacterium]|jgi:hypothetical protein|nr:hypothetical protein [Nitrospiraceae bacterium]
MAAIFHHVFEMAQEWMTELKETEGQLPATELHITGSWFSSAVLQGVGNKTRPFLEWMESGIVTV